MSSKDNNPRNPFGRVNTTYRYLMGKGEDQSFDSVANEDRRVRNNLAPPQLRSAFMEEISVASRLGFCVGDMAEFSLRLQHDHFLTTRERAWSNNIEDEDLIVGSRLDGSSSELPLPKLWKWHLETFLNFEQANAVAFCQPLAALKMGSSKSEIAKLSEISKEHGFELKKVGAESKPSAFDGLLLFPSLGLLAWSDSLANLLIALEKINFQCELTS